MKLSTTLLLLFSFMATKNMMAQTPLAEPKLEFIFEAKVTLDPAQELGVTTYRKRRIIPITGGTFDGPLSILAVFIVKMMLNNN